MLLVGDKELDAGSVSVRSYVEGDLGPRPVEELVNTMVRQVEDKT
jgi:threonyl-tRNA synthetase